VADNGGEYKRKNKVSKFGLEKKMVVPLEADRVDVVILGK
jgi:hypothetical protein